MRKGERRSFLADAVPYLLTHSRFVGRWGGWMALGAYLVLIWLGNASTGVMQHLADPLWEWLGWQRSSPLVRAVAKLCVPALVFVGAVFLIRRQVGRRQAAVEVEGGEPGTLFAHRGLIGSLSPFGAFGGTPEETRRLREELQAAVVRAPGSGVNHRDRLLQILYGTRWGPLAAAVEVHRERLTHVWVLASQAVKDDVPLFEECVQCLTDGKAAVAPVRIDDHNSVQNVRRRMLEFYESDLPRSGLRENQVIADITGGSAAMSAGIVLATLDEQRHVEYLKQGPEKLSVEAGLERLRSRFQYVHTTPADVARAFVSYLERPAGADGLRR